MNTWIESAPNRGSWRGLIVLVVSVVVALAAGWLGSLATAPNIPTWYAGLAKPAFNPPNAIFPVVWTILYVLMGVAAWLVWRAPGDAGERRRALAAYTVQLVVNVAWSFAFFGAHSPLAGLAVIVLLVLAILWTMVDFHRISRVAAWLLAPYLAWVLFATVLNGAIFVLNP